MIKLLFLSGSTRRNSHNKKLAQLGAKLAQQDGVQTKFIDLLDYPMPIYNGDDEEKSGLPENAKKLKKIFVEHDGFFIASPEYNSSLSALLKNSLDWISRVHEQDELSLVAFAGKVSAISAASPGGLGGIKGLVPLRMMLGNIGVHVIPKQVAISSAFKAFDQDGNLLDLTQLEMLEGVVKQFVEVTKKLK
ncbi:MAG: chromate reductase [Francisellaceae bacterium]|jgi:chromate reductase